MSEGLRKATEKCADLEARANAAYDKMTEAKASYEFLGALATQAREILAMCLESDGAATTAPVPPKAVPAPAPVRRGRPPSKTLTVAAEEYHGLRRGKRSLRNEALEEFKTARDGISPSQMTATLRVRGKVTVAQVQKQFDHWAKKGQIEPYPDGEHGAWRHVDHRPKATTFSPELGMGPAHYAEEGGGIITGNGADEDYDGSTSNTEFDGIIELLKEVGDKGLSKGEIQAYGGIPAEEIDDAENAGVIRLRQEDEHYLLSHAER